MEGTVMGNQYQLIPSHKNQFYLRIQTNSSNLVDWYQTIINFCSSWVAEQNSWVRYFLRLLEQHWFKTLQWRHNERDRVSNHQPHDCLLNRLFGRRPKKASKLRVTGLCVGSSPGTGEFPAQMASNAKNVFIWWRHHDLTYFRDIKIVPVDKIAIGIQQSLFFFFMMTSSNGNIFRVTGPLARSPVNSPHKGQWRGALTFSLICAWINGWVNNREDSDSRRHSIHYDVTVMLQRLARPLSVLAIEGRLLIYAQHVNLASFGVDP